MRKRYLFLALSMLCFCDRLPAAKSGAVFYPPALVERIRRNVAGDPWAAGIRDQAVQMAQPWVEKSDTELWQSMFAPSITRSWMVWSNGHCPACKKSVPMYGWKIDALGRPWKVQCPHCLEFFPKNDFHAFYLSGLDEHGCFDPQRADRSSLYHSDHPDPSEPLHRFGVDDGEGYVEGPNRWRFIGAYLIYGQWKQWIMTGIRSLAVAHVLTGERRYAHKAAVLFDRIADLYPQFDFSRQGLSYERHDPIIGHGYVTVWHDSCEEVRELALAYDMIYEAMRKDEDLAAFLCRQAERYHTVRAKTSLVDICRNIEDGIFRDALKNRLKIESNFPRTDATMTILETVLGWPENRSQILGTIDRFLEKSTQADGLSGEKGLSGYSAGTSRGLAQFLSLYSRLDGRFLGELFQRHPNLAKTYRFHLDTWFQREYYPNIGDTGSFGRKTDRYAGVTFYKSPLPADLSTYAFTSVYSLFWQLYQITGDPDYVRLLYRENERTLKDLPYDLFCSDKQALQQQVENVLKNAGPEPEPASLNLGKWCLAMLYSGTGNFRRALWADYDIGGNHGHADGLNMGLLAYGIDLIPGFGYPAVQFGGWYSPKAIWYRKTAAHNTVVVNGLDQIPQVGERETEPAAVQLNPLKNHRPGRTRFWLQGREVQGLCLDGADLYRTIELQQYQRTLFLVDLSPADFYIVDLFRVTGGQDHAKFLHGYFGALTTRGLELKPAADYGFATQMSRFRSDRHPAPAWQAVWEIEDSYHYRTGKPPLYLAYTDLTRGAEAAVADTWISLGFQDGRTATIPSLMVRRRTEEGVLQSTFLGILQAYENRSSIESVQRYDLFSGDRRKLGDQNAAVAVRFTDGRTDLLLAMDSQSLLQKTSPGGKNPWVHVKEWDCRTDGTFVLIRMDREKRVQKVAVLGAGLVSIGKLQLVLSRPEFLELELQPDSVRVLTGSSRSIRSCRLAGKPMRILDSR